MSFIRILNHGSAPKCRLDFSLHTVDTSKPVNIAVFFTGINARLNLPCIFCQQYMVKKRKMQHYILQSIAVFFVLCHWKSLVWSCKTMIGVKLSIRCPRPKMSLLASEASWKITVFALFIMLTITGNISESNKLRKIGEIKSFTLSVMDVFHIFWRRHKLDTDKNIGTWKIYYLSAMCQPRELNALHFQY